MVDPVITPAAAVAVAGAWVAKEGVGKLLGPSFEYMGDGLKGIIQKRNEAAQVIIDNAIGKSGDKLDQPGEVPPKVLNTILNDGTYATDPLAMEYFGGVLASSRTELGRDDRGDRMAKVVANLSSYQLRAHYLIYTTISQLFNNQEKSLGISETRRKLQIFIPYQEFMLAAAFTEEEMVNQQLMQHIWAGLHSDNLIEGTWQFGEIIHLEKIFKDAPCAGIVCQPSVAGAELFLWAHGAGDKPIDYLFSDELSSQFEGLPGSVPGTLATET